MRDDHFPTMGYWARVTLTVTAIVALLVAAWTVRSILLIGSSLAGLAGALVALPIVAAIKVAIRELWPGWSHRPPGPTRRRPSLTCELHFRQA